MTHDEMNYTISGGSFNKRIRNLFHFTIEENEKSGKLMVRDDKSGLIVGGGFADIGAAVRAYHIEDMRRSGVL